MPEIKPTPSTCDHPFVHIGGIKEPWNGQHRVIKGRCDACSKVVERQVDQFEMDTGERTQRWYR